jgi:hypothetical protein
MTTRKTKIIPPSDPHQHAVFDAGGTLIYAPMPSREVWRNIVNVYESYLPGCGVPTHVAGTNGGKMPCGGELTELDGRTHKQFCARCEDKLKMEGVI